MLLTNAENSAAGEHCRACLASVGSSLGSALRVLEVPTRPLKPLAIHLIIAPSTLLGSS